jgi:hypothetical protein
VILKNTNLSKLFSLVGLFMVLSCDEPQKDDVVSILSDSQFTFHQDQNKIYFAINAAKTMNGIQIDSVTLDWYGSSRSNTKDVLTLNDDGFDGDIIMNDDLYSIKILNDSTVIKNILKDDSGFVFLDFNAIYDSEVLLIRDSMKIGNIIPRIISINAPDTINRPSDATISLETISAEVFDTDGLETIKWVGFTSFHIDGDSIMNNGNYIYLHDDGSEIILYEPNITSGDETKDDGVFSFRIPIYGQGFTEPGFQTKTGRFVWRFAAQDLLNDYTNIVEHEIIIQ